MSWYGITRLTLCELTLRALHTSIRTWCHTEQGWPRTLSDYVETVHSGRGPQNLIWRHVTHRCYLVTNYCSFYAWYGFYILRAPSVASRCDVSQQVIGPRGGSGCMFWRPSAIRSRATVTEIIGPTPFDSGYLLATYLPLMQPFGCIQKMSIEPLGAKGQCLYHAEQCG